MIEVILLLAVGLSATILGMDWWHGLPPNTTRQFVGRETCAECHQPHLEKFSGSHHDLAMDVATEKTVLADFNDATLEHYGVTSRMFRKDGKFFVNTEGPDGKLADFEVKYVFGVDPLQNYMVEFDRTADMPSEEVARVQVLRVSWDTRKKKWFHLDPPDVKERLAPTDDLHWTGIGQRWNTMCAECHSTNLQKGFDVASLSYHTTFSEIDVSCESCHGPGSSHVTLAKGIKSYRSLFWDRKEGTAIVSLKTNDSLKTPARSKIEIDTCASCHSRRRILQNGFQAGCNFDDYFALEGIQQGIYHPDGQLLDEAYEVGSFCQSKMFHKGIKCTDCHDPHSSKPKFEGNKLCTSCHAHSPGKYDTPAHHGHKQGTAGASCVACHMPTTTYMDVHVRHDHSLRIPRPDLSLELGTPNACTACHISDTKLPMEQRPTSPTPNRPVEYADWLAAVRDKNFVVRDELRRIDTWCNAACDKWFGSQRKKPAHFGAAMAAAFEENPQARDLLLKVVKDREVPAIARSSASLELSAYAPSGDGTSELFLTFKDLINDREPMVRAAAITGLQSGPDETVRKALVPLLKDPSTFVRGEAARALARYPESDFRMSEPIVRQTELTHFLEGLMVMNDRAGSHLQAGILFEELQDTTRAREYYQNALRIEPRTTGPRGQLAELLQRIAAGIEQQAMSMLQSGQQAQARPLFEELGILQAEAARLRAEELTLLERDARLLPAFAPLQSRLGSARLSQGWIREGESALEMAVRLAPRSPGVLFSWGSWLRDRGRFEEALVVAEQLCLVRPEEPAFRELRKELQQAAGPQPIPESKTAPR